MSFAEIFAFVLLIASGVAVVRLNNAVHAALALIANFLVIATLYVALEARFVAMAQIIVYGGAIVVLFLFVIMLLQAANANVGEDLLPRLQIPAIIGAVGLGGALIYALTRFQAPANPPALGGGLPQALGLLLYGEDRWLYALLAVGFLLLVATVAAVVLVEPERIVQATGHAAHPKSGEPRPADDKEVVHR